MIGQVFTLVLKRFFYKICCIGLYTILLSKILQTIFYCKITVKYVFKCTLFILFLMCVYSTTYEVLVEW
uniref:Uncharacterized protein n=1 Tax=Ciona intestinalis TaxID=7719 RepID=H2Y2U1_CIOIN